MRIERAEIIGLTRDRHLNHVYVVGIPDWRSYRFIGFD
jgi:hypothetical protein